MQYHFTNLATVVNSLLPQVALLSNVTWEQRQGDVSKPGRELTAYTCGAYVQEIERDGCTGGRSIYHVLCNSMFLHYKSEKTNTDTSSS